MSFIKWIVLLPVALLAQMLGAHTFLYRKIGVRDDPMFRMLTTKTSGIFKRDDGVWMVRKYGVTIGWLITNHQAHWCRYIFKIGGR